MADTHPPGWTEEIKDLTPEAQELFENYSKISSDEIKPHIKKIRDEAFKIHPYPCLATFAFLELMDTQSPIYNEVLNRLKNGAKYLDIGCCVGQDIRKLVYDGAPSENTYGSDLEKGFLDMGYDLFLDRETLRTTFIAADVFDSESELSKLEGKIHIIHAALFLHLFTEEQCFQAVKRMVKLFEDEKNVLFIGKQLGRVEAGPISEHRYRHNDESFANLWKQIGDETGMKWEVDAKLEDEDLYEMAAKMGMKANFLPEGTRYLTFSVRRVA
ncbi:hypothetical protein P280DRAFT_420196 [Massarina eburnea CBS 473.64]|uniref:Methyltransferase domain-containing protein n=1 Tax=Massarina eburnea CBS 473.64 TaxID=1395130 RepID=A0A6A6S7Y5_9PLEO|nr:hypothetical protein P280DRAFT_420196 [Massarina eburnea CBS 473.64]